MTVFSLCRILSSRPLPQLEKVDDRIPGANDQCKCAENLKSQIPQKTALQLVNKLTAAAVYEEMS